MPMNVQKAYRTANILDYKKIPLTYNHKNVMSKQK